MCARKLWKKWIAGTAGVLALAITTQAQLFTGSLSFVGGAVINDLLPNATAFSSFYGPGGPGSSPVVQGGQETGAYAALNGGNISVPFSAFTFNPAPAASFQLWNFMYNTVTYSFEITSVTTDVQNVYPLGNGQSLGFLNVGGNGTATISGVGSTPATWSITGTTADSSSVTITIGSSVNAVPEPPTMPLAAAGLLALGLICRNRLQPAFQGKR